MAHASCVCALTAVSMCACVPQNVLPILVGVLITVAHVHDEETKVLCTLHFKPNAALHHSPLTTHHNEQPNSNGTAKVWTCRPFEPHHMQYTCVATFANRNRTHHGASFHTVPFTVMDIHVHFESGVRREQRATVESESFDRVWGNFDVGEWSRSTGDQVSVELFVV